MKRNQNGFTLIEVLVALFIMAIMAALSWRGLEVMLRSREITQKRVDEVAAFQNVMRQWEADLNAVFPLSGSATATASVTTSVTASAPAGSPTSAPSKVEPIHCVAMAMKSRVSLNP